MNTLTGLVYVAIA